MIGEQVGGRYRLERELGRGGFGAVFVAVQEDMGRRVAVKMLHRHHLEGVGVDRFRREAQLAQRGAYGSVRILCGPHQCVAPNTDPRPGQSCEGGVCK